MRKTKINPLIKKIKSNKIDPDYIRIVINCDYYLAGWMGDAEPDDFIQKYFIDFELVELTDNDIETKDVIGGAWCYYISGYDSIHNCFVDMRDIADADSGDLLTAVKPITDEDGSLLDDYLGCDMLYIDKFYIKPKYRGKGIGQLVFASILDVIGRRAGAITIIPCPTEDDGNERMDKKDPRYKSQLKLMTDFIKKFGFDEVNKKDKVWVKNTQYQ
jgi:predicted GNAT family acetyltransferase